LTSLLQAEVESPADARRPLALAVFDILDTWFRRSNFDCCSAIDTVSDTAGPSPCRRAPGSDDPTPPRHGPGLSRQTLERYAEQAGSPNPQEAAHQLQMLMLGAILAAGCGEELAALRARSLAELVLQGAPADRSPGSPDPAGGRASLVPLELD
jgi:hypothetical protein